MILFIVTVLTLLVLFSLLPPIKKAAHWLLVVVSHSGTEHAVIYILC